MLSYTHKGGAEWRADTHPSRRSVSQRSSDAVLRAKAPPRARPARSLGSEYPTAGAAVLMDGACSKLPVSLATWHVAFTLLSRFLSICCARNSSLRVKPIANTHTTHTWLQTYMCRNNAGYSYAEKPCTVEKTKRKVLVAFTNSSLLLYWLMSTTVFPVLRLQTAPPRRRLVPEESLRGISMLLPLPLPVRAPAVTAAALLRVPCVLAHPVPGSVALPLLRSRSPWLSNIS